MELIKLNYSKKLAIAIRSDHIINRNISSICQDRCSIMSICNDPVLRKLEAGNSQFTVMCLNIILSAYNQLDARSSELFDKECLGIKYLSLFIFSYARRNKDKIF